MKRKVIAAALCTAIMAIAMGFVVMAKTADAGANERNYKAFVKTGASIASNPNGDEDIPVASAPEATYVSDQEELQDALQKSGEIILNADINLTKPLGTWEGVNLTIDGAGHKIYTGENPYLWGILWVEKNAEVSLQNITIDATGMDLDEKLEDGRYQDYYAILTREGTKLTINGGTNIICNDREEGIEIKNQEKGGIFLNGTGIMNGGEISGFYGSGITVRGKFTLEDGLLSRISEGGGAINNVGNTTINGGTISGSDMGVFNSGNLLMTRGNITANRVGVKNNPEDGISHVQYKPCAELKGGTIAGNKVYGAQNCKKGKLIINGVEITDKVNGADVTNEVKGMAFSGMRLFAESRRSASPSILISNETGSTLIIQTGSIVSNAPNGIAVYNDGTSIVKMTGGKVSVNGVGSVAIRNDNTQSGSVKLSGGSVKTVTGSSAVGGNGSTSMTGVTVNGTVINTSESGGSGSSGSSDSSGGSTISNSVRKPVIPETPGAWLKDQTGWKFTAPDKTSYANTWIRSNSQWYWIGTDNYMKTGWNQLSGKWYYLTPVSGEMKTGWLHDGDAWYYLDAAGARKTGWLQEGSKWYYLNQDGKMAVNTMTPDGYKVDGSGVWVK